MTPTSTQGPVRQNLTRHHLVASRAVCTFVDRGDSQCDLRGPGAATRFVLREQLSYGDNFMMFWEMIFRVILAYLRKLASQPRGRSASVPSHGLEPIKSYCRGQIINVSRADGADANTHLTFTVARADVLPKSRLPPMVVIGEQVRQCLQHALMRLGCIRFGLCSFFLEQLQETVCALNWNSQRLGRAGARARL